jgi:beta-lactam-binding protein with PASTA domain
MGQVVSQSPARGPSEAKGATISINISKGTGTATGPALSGLSADVAGTQLAQLGLKGTPKTVPGSAPEGTVVAPDPAAGTTVDTGSAVHCNFSNGKKTEMVSVPQLVDLSRYAHAQLDQVGLSHTVYVGPSDEKIGYVVAQDPPGGTPIDAGRTCTSTPREAASAACVTGRLCQQRQSSIRLGGSVRRRRSGSRHTVIRKQRRDSFTVSGRALRRGLFVDRFVAA